VIQSLRRAPRCFAGLMVVSLVSVLAVTAARAESPGNAGARPGRVTEGTMFWRTERQEALVQTGFNFLRTAHAAYLCMSEDHQRRVDHLRKGRSATRAVTPKVSSR